MTLESAPPERSSTCRNSSQIHLSVGFPQRTEDTVAVELCVNRTGHLIEQSPDDARLVRLPGNSPKRPPATATVTAAIFQPPLKF